MMQWRLTNVIRLWIISEPNRDNGRSYSSAFLSLMATTARISRNAPNA